LRRGRRAGRAGTVLGEVPQPAHDAPGRDRPARRTHESADRVRERGNRFVLTEHDHRATRFALLLVGGDGTYHPLYEGLDAELLLLIDDLSTTPED